jgi:hypothetical protein
MRTLSTISAAVTLAALSHGARAEDCTQRPTQVEQIRCLQYTVEHLQRQLDRLVPKQEWSPSVSLNGRLEPPPPPEGRSIEQMIDEKIRRAMEPRLHMLPNRLP